MENIQTSVLDRMSKDEFEAFSEFVKVFPINGHEPDQCGFIAKPDLIGIRFDNAGHLNESALFLERVTKGKIDLFRFNLATLLAFAKFGFEQAVVDKK